MTMTTGGKAAVAGFFTVAMAATLGVLADGKMGVSAGRAERVKAAVNAQAEASRGWV